jgi:arginine decarboxylase
MDQRFILLPINKWDNEYQRVNIGGLSCDVSDYYNYGMEIDQLYLPKISNNEPLYIGYFHTGAYQDSLSGYGGIKHCLIPAPKHIVINRDEDGKIHHQLFAEEQQSESMLKLLGY